MYLPVGENLPSYKAPSPDFMASKLFLRINCKFKVCCVSPIVSIFNLHSFWCFGWRKRSMGNCWKFIGKKFWISFEMQVYLIYFISIIKTFLGIFNEGKRTCRILSLLYQHTSWDSQVNFIIFFHYIFSDNNSRTIVAKI